MTPRSWECAIDDPNLMQTVDDRAMTNARPCAHQDEAARLNDPAGLTPFQALYPTLDLAFWRKPQSSNLGSNGARLRPSTGV